MAIASHAATDGHGFAPKATPKSEAQPLENPPTTLQILATALSLLADWQNNPHLKERFDKLGG
ncbi:MAG: hypothetical protein AAFY59_01775 [Pseudomonadota bacterium]